MADSVLTTTGVALPPPVMLPANPGTTAPAISGAARPAPSSPSASATFNLRSSISSPNRLVSRARKESPGIQAGPRELARRHREVVVAVGRARDGHLPAATRHAAHGQRAAIEVVATPAVDGGV